MSCKGCERRHVGCHGTCEDYLQEQEERKRRNDQLFKAKNLDRALTSREFIRMERAKKKKGVKK